MQTTIDTIRVRDYERFEKSRRFEEMTDIAERLGYPIDTTIDYEMRDGAAYCVTDTVSRPFHNQTLLALERGEALYDGDQAFEVERLRLEHEEALLVDSFGRGELDGDVLIKLSKVPDAVAEGRTCIKGYRRDLLRSFVRVYYPTHQGVACRLFTLDHNSVGGMAEVSTLLSIDAMGPSEQVLASHALHQTTGEPEGYVDQLIERVKLAYDVARQRETGERSYAGSRFVDKHNAMDEIATQSLLVDRHMQAIADIMGRSRSETMLEEERKKTAAAIKLASLGYSIDSNADSSVAAEVANGNYDRECATATNGMNQTQNMENVWTQGECRVCFAKTRIGSCMVCARCAAADDRGVDLLKLRDDNLRRRQTKTHMAQKALRPQPMAQTPSKGDRIRQQYGEYARLRSRHVIGGAVREVYDARVPNEIVAVL